ncbi:MAG: cytochrome c [Myxococcales bacterium]|nr:cytochrome c [Myxococcales bacterium]
MALGLIVALLAGCDDGGGSSAEDAAVAVDGAVDAAPMVDAELDAAAQPDAADLPDAAAPDAEVGGPPVAWRLLCAACHGANGAGTDLGYELRHPVRDYAEWVVRNGRDMPGELPATMLAYGPDQVSDEELTAIFDWLDDFNQPATGTGLYLDYCANCHGRDGRGGVVGVTMVGRTASSIRRHVRGGEGGRNYPLRRLYMPAFGADVISDAELELIIDHVAGL